MAGQATKGTQKPVLTIDDARAMRKWWADNVGRVHAKEISGPQLRKELADLWKLHPTTIRNILGGKTHREPNA